MQAKIPGLEQEEAEQIAVDDMVAKRTMKKLVFWGETQVFSTREERRKGRG